MDLPIKPIEPAVTERFDQVYHPEKSSGERQKIDDRKGRKRRRQHDADDTSQKEDSVELSTETGTAEGAAPVANRQNVASDEATERDGSETGKRKPLDIEA